VDLHGAGAGLPVSRLWQQGCAARAGGVGGAVEAAGLGGVEAKLAGRAAEAYWAVGDVQLPYLTGPHGDLHHRWLGLRRLGSSALRAARVRRCGAHRGDVDGNG
jgi:hypothetical protein